MTIFNSYVSLPEGTTYKLHEFTHLLASPHERSGLEGLEHLGAAKERHIPAPLGHGQLHEEVVRYLHVLTSSY